MTARRVGISGAELNSNHVVAWRVIYGSLSSLDTEAALVGLPQRFAILNEYFTRAFVLRRRRAVEMPAAGEEGIRPGLERAREAGFHKLCQNATPVLVSQLAIADIEAGASDRIEIDANEPIVGNGVKSHIGSVMKGVGHPATLEERREPAR